MPGKGRAKAKQMRRNAKPKKQPEKKATATFAAAQQVFHAANNRRNPEIFQDCGQVVAYLEGVENGQICQNCQNKKEKEEPDAKD